MHVLTTPLELSVEDGNLVLEILRTMQADIAGLRASNKEILHRLSALELTTAQMALTLANHEARFDRIEARLDRIAKRLELRDA
jgi:hypothetical protein